MDADVWEKVYGQCELSRARLQFELRKVLHSKVKGKIYINNRKKLEEEVKIVTTVRTENV